MINFALNATSTGTVDPKALAIFAPFLGIGFGLIIVLALWTIVWKGLALWKAARKGDKIWFVILLIVNTVGILEIIYLLMNRDQKQQVAVAEKNLPTTNQ
ncbi:MAG: DUF5652 family protein [bacterium]